MGKNRDKLGIIAAIVEAASPIATKTRTMYMSNLSFKLLEKYLTLSINVGFIDKDGSTYKTTEKRTQFLKRYLHFRERYHLAQSTLNGLMG